MNKLSSFLLSGAICVTTFYLSSCDKDESFPTSGIKGLPTAITSDNQTLRLAYTENRLSELQWSEGSTLRFSYTSHALDNLITLPPKGVADGYGSTTFEHKGTTIQISSSGEPSLDITHRLSMDLDENGIPTRITDLGSFRHSGENQTQEHPGESYTLFTTCPETGSLSKMEIYSRTDSTLLATYTYTYDNRRGMAGLIDLPIWFPYYWEYTRRYSNDIREHLFLNRTHNVTQITYTDQRSSTGENLLFTYSYGSDGYPRFVEQAGEQIEIHY